jgi:hypothetical protein
VDVPMARETPAANVSEELVIVEVQHCAYTGEDYIVRIEDDYGHEE